MGESPMTSMGMPVRLFAYTLAVYLTSLAKGADRFDLPSDMGEVVSLRDQHHFMQGFPKKDGSDGSFWFIMYYSPTCPICKGMMPLLKDLSVSTALKSDRDPGRKMQVGLVDCRANKFGCGLAKVKQYPTLKHTTNGGITWAEYRGVKSVQALQYAVHRIMNPSTYIKPLANMPALQEATAFAPNQEHAGVKVVLTTPEADGAPIQAFRELVSQAGSFTSTSFFVMVRPKLKSSTLTVYKDGPSEQWPGPAPHSAADLKGGDRSEREAFLEKYGGASGPEWKAEEILPWLSTRRHLAVEELHRENLHEISSMPDKLTMMMVHDSTQEDEGRFLMRAMRELANEDKGRHLKRFTMGRLASQHWPDWCKEQGIESSDLPLLLVVDAPWSMQYRNDSIATRIREATRSRWVAKFSEIASEFLDNVASGTEPEQGTITARISRWVAELGWGGKGLLLLFVMAIVVAGIVLCFIACDDDPPVRPPPRKSPVGKAAASLGKEDAKQD